jgi:hypothetical protein
MFTRNFVWYLTVTNLDANSTPRLTSDYERLLVVRDGNKVRLRHGELWCLQLARDTWFHDEGGLLRYSALVHGTPYYIIQKHHITGYAQLACTKFYVFFFYIIVRIYKHFLQHLYCAQVSQEMLTNQQMTRTLSDKQRSWPVSVCVFIT